MENHHFYWGNHGKSWGNQLQDGAPKRDVNVGLDSPHEY